jgi:hypothetical protein
MTGFFKTLFTPAAKQVEDHVPTSSNDDAPITPTIRTDLYDLAERIRRMSQGKASVPQSTPK